jgi:hypothetical protein
MSGLNLTVNFHNAVYKYSKDEIESGGLVSPIGTCDIYSIIKHEESPPVLMGYFWSFNDRNDLIQLTQPVTLEELAFILREMQSRRYNSKDD